MSGPPLLSAVLGSHDSHGCGQAQQPNLWIAHLEGDVGDLAKEVAELEQQVEEARELRAIAERLDDEIAANLEEIESIGSAVREAHFDLDNQIAEHDFMAVEQSVDSVRGLVDPRTVLSVVDAVLLLTAIRDDSAVPSYKWPRKLAEGVNPDSTPRLTQAQLDAQYAKELDDGARDWESFWGDTDWDDSQRDDQWETDRGERELEAMRNLAGKAADNIREIVEEIGESIWPELVASVEAGDRDSAVAHLLDAVRVAAELDSAYELYQANLSRLYTVSPGALGAMGEHLMGMETWLAAQTDRNPEE
ncbi:hypothetical protein [Streptacidiphilus fuscans]|uniref:Uncharacterized protein n=1 Tax=Streptacidiphilus fuscans TaxID=2789292 RepID=A0A931B8T4_9ACTN|nr:hypothetical protein [Streptacidiphilus fuscans]MBF9072236.1 hypothetical protein [Streptacidiphilus fuscans]